jgi:hypothetical protein
MKTHFRVAILSARRLCHRPKAKRILDLLHRTKKRPMRERLSVFVSIILFAFAATAATGNRSFAVETSAVRIDGGNVVLNEEAFSGDVLTFTIEGKAYRAGLVGREANLEGEVLRFTLPGAPTRSTVTRIGNLKAVTLVTRDASYHLRPSAEDVSVLVLESEDQNAATAAFDLRNDTMTSFEVAVRTGNFKLINIQPLATATTSRRRSVNPSPTVEHRNIAIYTTRFAAHYGGNVDNVRLAIQHAFDVRDTVLRDSGVSGVRDTLVYAEQRDNSAWLANQVNDALAAFGADPYVQGLRIKWQANAGYWDSNPTADATGAAIVFEGQPSAVDGTYYIGWQSEVFEELVAHELGHVGGGEHNKSNATQYACPYCYGWFDTYSRDIMATSCGAMDCNRIMMYSSPNVLYHAEFWDYQADVVPGSTQENVARRLSETRYDVRDFWKSISPP